MSVISSTLERNSWNIFSYTVISATLILGVAALISVLKQYGIEIVHSDFGKSLMRQYVWMREALLESALSYALNMVHEETRGKIANLIVISTAISVGISVVVYIPWLKNNSVFIKEVENVLPSIRPIYILTCLFATLVYAAILTSYIGGLAFTLYHLKWEPLLFGLAISVAVFGFLLSPLLLFRGFLYWLSTGSERVLRFFEDEKDKTIWSIWQSIPVLLLCLIFATSLLVVVAGIDWFIVNSLQSGTDI
jgi:hypothetical protein